jgi:hypothetical protein
MDSANEGTPLVGAAATNTFSVSFRNESDSSNSKGNVNVATPDSNTGYSKGILSKGILGKGNGGKGSGSGTGSYVKRDSSGYPSLGSTFAGISEPVTRGWLLLFFNLVSLLACITGALISFFQTITLLLAYDLVFQDTMCIILVVYQVVFGIIIVLVEMVIILQYYINVFLRLCFVLFLDCCKLQKHFAINPFINLSLLYLHLFLN